MALTLKVNGVKIKTPDTFKIQKYNLSKSGRTSSGLMTMDIIAKKRKFIMKWGGISGTALNQILDLVDTDTAFFTFEYQENGTTKTATCYNGDIDHEVYRTDGVWWWKDIEFHFIEQ